MANVAVTRKDALASVKEFNSEVRSISGACKVIQMFWPKAQTAMAYIGINAKGNVTPKNIFANIADTLKEKGKDGNYTCYVWVKEFDKVVKKSEDGAKVTTTYKLYKGRRVFTWVKKEVTAWNVNTLFAILEQSKNGGVMPEYPADMAEYKKCVVKAESVAAAKAKAVATKKAATKKAVKAESVTAAKAKAVATKKVTTKKAA